MKPRIVVFIGSALTLLAFAAATVLYDRLPASLPVHWGLNGRADGFMEKPFGVYMHPAMIAFSTGLTWVLPLISPHRFRIEPFAHSYGLIMLALILIFSWITAIVFAAELGLGVPVDRLVLAGIGFLLGVIGNLLGKVTPNFFVGIRSPWTLAHREVWLRVHRLGGRMMVVAGLVLTLAAVLGLPLTIPFLIVLAAIFWPLVYSYVLYRKLTRAEGSSG